MFSVMPDRAILERISAVREPVDQLALSFAYGKIVHEGLTLAIRRSSQRGQVEFVQPPGRTRARHRHGTAAGTTRDLVSETVAIAAFHPVGRHRWNPGRLSTKRNPSVS